LPHVASSDGARVFYRTLGDGPPLVLCCASFSTHRHWTHQEAALARSFRVVSWDYRGHGLSEAPERDARYSLAQVVRDLAAVHQAAAGDEPAWVAGLSIGGLVALRYALDFPARVRALVLCNTGPGFKNAEAAQGWQTMLERAAAKMEEVGLPEYVRGRRAQAELLGLHPDSEPALEALSGILASSVPGLTRFARRVAGPVPNLIDELPAVRVPTLVLAGEHDAAFERASHVLAGRIPGARRVVLAGAGHVLNLDQPDAFVRAIEEFRASVL
jgi:pimeloyl-ACP methyl ester carboxylesterase